MGRKTSAIDVANYFLAKQDEEAGDLISNLKLQKLLYYAQGLHLASEGKPLFEEPIQAWTHGPVTPDVYHTFKGYGAAPIPCPQGFDISNLTASLRDFLDEVYDVYGQFSAWKLRNMTHTETPYKLAEDSGGEISHESMSGYFKEFVVS